MGFATVLYGLLVWSFLFSPAGTSSANKNSNFAAGRYSIVQLFYWRYVDIAEECERFLGPYNYAGLQTSPPSENVIVWHPWYNTVEERPWFEIYQPVSYNINNRLGTESEFTDMVQRCNAVNVRVYIDGVFNHMTANDAGQGTGTGGSYYDASAEEFDGVPYTSADFHTCAECPSSDCSIQDYGDATQVRNCQLTGLLDLDQSEQDVRNKVVAFMNKLIDIGVAGFRLDAAKHMWPNDVSAIVDSLNDLNTNYFAAGSKAYIYQEVIDNDGEAVSYTEYTGIGDVTEFKVGTHLAEVFRRQTAAKYLVNWGEGWGMMNGYDALVFVDNHDTQRGGGPPGNNVLTFFDSRMYKMANAFMLGHYYGDTRVMSSFSWERIWVDGQDTNNWQGPPHDSNFNVLPVVVNSDLTCSNGWVCEHRWRQIYNMVRFRNVVFGTDLENWWDNGNNMIAFSRGNMGFLVINNEESADLNTYLQTGLPAGTYCDVISGNLENGSCTGATITVNGDGTAYFSISYQADDPMVAIHVEAKL